MHLAVVLRGFLITGIMGITRDEYLEALSIIDSYHRQIDFQNKPVGDIVKKESELKKGDKAVCIRVHNNYKRCLTINKFYEVKDVYKVYDGRIKFLIIDDQNKEKNFFFKNSQFNFFS